MQPFGTQTESMEREIQRRQCYESIRKYAQLLIVLPLVGLLAASCNGENNMSSGSSDDLTSTGSPMINDVSTSIDAASAPAGQPPADAVPVASAETLEIPTDFFHRDGYASIDVVRVDLRTDTTRGVCTEDDLSGCTLDDVNADVDTSDNLAPEIEVQFQATDYANDGSSSNAELRQRGATTRQFPQKSYRVKIDRDALLWRNERRLQLNKHPADLSRIRNKLSFDLMSNVPALPSLRTQFVNLWIDDGQGPVDYGLFTHVEALQEESLENRGWEEDDNIYKAEQFTFSTRDLDALAIDETGAPLDEDAFEERLEIKTGADDHTQLIAMLVAINDPAQNFETVLDKYFDRENVLMWVTVNFLLGQKDSTTHNFYLYNPAGSEKFYFLPWDYDAAFYIETELDETLANDELDERLFYGYARGANSVFLDRYFRLPDINDSIVNAADSLRNGPLSDAEISERALLYGSVIRPFTTRQPDLAHLSLSAENAEDEFDARIQQLPEYVAINHQVLRDGLGIPMPHTLETPVLTDDEWVLSWSPAYDVLGHSVSYDLQVSSNLIFSASAIVFEISGIADDPVKIEYSVPASNLPEVPLYYRVIARSSNDPQRFWQVAKNILRIDGTAWYGIQRLEENDADSIDD